MTNANLFQAAEHAKPATFSTLMVRPVNFAYNEQTAVNNFFMDRFNRNKNPQSKALKEFDSFADSLHRNGVNVIVVEALKEPASPDSIFPNNWFSTHEDGSIFLYPMEAQNRRIERRMDIIEVLRKNFLVSSIIDLSKSEEQGQFLEGTGSMVLDRKNKIAYACLSPRTHLSVLSDFCKKAGYRAVAFNATDENHHLIYHTNVMMCIGNTFTTICTDVIRDKQQLKQVQESLEESGREIIHISLSQLQHFAGNMLELASQAGRRLIVMSEQAYQTLTPEQIKQFEKHGQIVFSPLSTIETVGGGSARCMIAEIYLPRLPQN